MPGDPELAPLMKTWSAMAVAGSALTGPVLLGILLDASAGWSPWGTLGGIALGLVGCLSSLVAINQRNLKAEQQHSQARTPTRPTPPESAE